jgi:hypothetical protein
MIYVINCNLCKPIKLDVLGVVDEEEAADDGGGGGRDGDADIFDDPRTFSRCTQGNTCDNLKQNYPVSNGG